VFRLSLPNGFGATARADHGVPSTRSLPGEPAPTGEAATKTHRDEVYV
jgi:hypothetical protein